jgi:HlyD family secretion protein
MPEPADLGVNARAVARRGEVVAHAARGSSVGRRRRWIVVSLAAVLAVPLIVWRALPDRVAATKVVRKDVARTLVLTGHVRPRARPQLGATVAGTVRDVLVREGDRVSRGQLLVRIDDAQAAAGVAQARAALAEMQANARALADQAGLVVQQTTRDLTRARELYGAGAISVRDLEVAEKAAADARSASSAANARADSARSTPLAKVARARGAVEAAEAQVALTRVTAPAAATVLARRVEPGDAVLPGQVLIELALAGPTEVAGFASEDNLAEMRMGATAVVSADAFPAQTFAARIAWLAPAVDPAQGTLEVRLAVPEPPSYLRPDMTVSINIEVARRANALVIPRALVHDGGSATPWVLVESGGRSARRNVHLGIVGEGEVEILSGLAEGEPVLPANVAQGMRIRLRP